MSLAAKLRRAPVRVVTGAYILNSGMTKLGATADSGTHEGIHGFAAGAYPQVKQVDPKTFTKGLGVAEIALGSALLLPIVPAGLAGLGLAAFSAGLVGLYWRTPGMHNEKDPRPTQEGIGLAKDTWMLGIGTSLVLDALLSESKVTSEDASVVPHRK